jgi:hypothetical protein
VDIEQPPVAVDGCSRRTNGRLAGLIALAASLAFAASASGALRAPLERASGSQPRSTGSQPAALISSGQPLILARHHRALGDSSRATGRKRNPATRHAPTITTQPSNVSVAIGALASFSSAATGSPTPSAQWQRSPNRGKTWSNVAGANSATYSFVTTAAESGYWYRVMYINSLGRAYTTAATLTVTAGSAAAPTVTSQPTSVTVVKSTVVSFSAAASGYPAPSVQWQYSINGGSTWANISGATATSYQLTAAFSENGYLYRAVFQNASGSAASAGATLTVTNGTISTTGAPAITTDPVGDTASVGGSASFSAAASGNPTPSVQWQVSSNGGTSWANATGANSTSYDFTATSGENNDEYRAVFTNPLGSAYTTAATLTVAEQSSNWSGYVTTGGVFSSVSADWTAPAVSCAPSSDTFSSQWIGIDGDTSDTVEQDGTEADCVSGTPYYGAWYEMYGDPSVDGGYEVPLDETVQPGDAMSASVSITGSNWTLTIADATQNWHFSTTIPNPNPAPSQASAEWIGERPEVCSSTCGLATLSDFGALTFTNATATDATETNQPISAFSYQPLEMVGSTLLASPGPLSTNGEQFTDTWDAST